ncbi:MAG: DUF721 domain-containing protein [Blastocatellia bacterium]|nr:DUF721 domain-containing protein [Blastocatellia bacterium]
MQDITKLLSHFIRLSQNQEDISQTAAFISWKIVVGEAISRISRPLSLNRKTLIIGVVDETWKKQLEQMSGQIIFKLNAVIGVVLVTNLDFQIAPEHFKAQQKVNPSTNAEVTDELILDAAEKITDPKLRNLYIKAAGKYLEAQEKVSKA